MLCWSRRKPSPVNNDFQGERLTKRAFTRRLDNRGFWRVDKQQPPALRRTVLGIVALRELEARGLTPFLAGPEGDGWMLPEVVKLADFGLTNASAAAEVVAVRERAGPRAMFWQGELDIGKTWADCERHTRRISRRLQE